MRTHKLKCTILIGISWLALGIIHQATAQTLKYHYDSLGRLTFVEDPTNGNRDYDYDAAGNRLLVSTSGATDASNEPASSSSSSCSSSSISGIPVAPKNLAVSFSGGLYISRWDASPGTNFYLLMFDRAAPKQVPASPCGVHSSADSLRPISVQACNASGCSSASNF